ncbi:hypothetical protein ACIBO6_06720 [Streptomyces luteogriseus]|uniref:hypothetical protein n=1 Tax=Streptomyces luteogriseus TaxID=68233 RepID=UPI0037B42EB3
MQSDHGWSFFGRVISSIAHADLLPPIAAWQLQGYETGMATWLEAVTEFGRLTCLVARFGAVTHGEHFAASLFVEGIRGGEQNDIPEVQTAPVLFSAVIDLSPTARGSPAIGRITSPPRGRAIGAGRRGTL